MTIAPEAPTQARDLQVRTDPAGKPLAIRHDGQIWLVDPATESQHWFDGDGREARRAAVAGSAARDGAGLGRATPGNAEHWRVQARLGSDSALRTFTLHRDALCTQWLLEAFSDGD